MNAELEALNDNVKEMMEFPEIDGREATYAQRWVSEDEDEGD